MNFLAIIENHNWGAADLDVATYVSTVQRQTFVWIQFEGYPPFALEGGEWL